MQKPYLLGTFFFLALAVLSASLAGLAELGILPAFEGLRWLRAHFITIGVVLEILFGALPAILEPERRPRLDMWLALNGGLVILLIGIPLVNPTLLITGGVLIFIAAAMLLNWLSDSEKLGGSRRFYLSSLLFLLLGVILGTGMWIGWGTWLRVPNPKEVHVHANLWGFAAIAFSGLLLDLYKPLTGKNLALGRGEDFIFWSMVLGASGLVVGPWASVNLITNAGLVLHTLGSIWLLVAAIRPLFRMRWKPSWTLLISSYLWFFIPVVVAPLIVANAENFPAAEVAQGGGPILVYGWLLQFVFGLLPVMLGSGEEGSWVSVIGLHAGALLYWTGLLFVPDQGGLLAGMAFLLWALAMLPAVRALLTGMGGVRTTGVKEGPFYVEEVETLE